MGILTKTKGTLHTTVSSLPAPDLSALVAIFKTLTTDNQAYGVIKARGATEAVAVSHRKRAEAQRRRDAAGGKADTTRTELSLADLIAAEADFAEADRIYRAALAAEAADAAELAPLTAKIDKQRNALWVALQEAHEDHKTALEGELEEAARRYFSIHATLQRLTGYGPTLHQLGLPHRDGRTFYADTSSPLPEHKALTDAAEPYLSMFYRTKGAAEEAFAATMKVTVRPAA